MKITDGHLVAFKLIGLMVVAFCGPIIIAFGKTAQHDYWPTWPALVGAMVGGISGAAAAVVAFCDNSLARWRENQKPNEAQPKGSTP